MRIGFNQIFLFNSNLLETILDCSTMSASTKTHGMGKGLLTHTAGHVKKHGAGKNLTTLWRVANPDARYFTYGVNFSEGTIQKKKNREQHHPLILRKLANKEQDKKKTSQRKRKVKYPKVQKQKQPPKGKCYLALENIKCLDMNEHYSRLVDDEELELQELQAGPNPLSCSAHFASNGSRGCSLCKDLLAKFPPNYVKMKTPLLLQPWVSSPELVKKLFQVFHFLCTYAVTINIFSFTFDEFAHAFHDENSLLLGQVHLLLLKLLLEDVAKELDNGFVSHASKNCKFISLLHSLQHHTYALEFWLNALNLLTWTEILRQVFVAAGFGSKIEMAPKESFNKEVNLMEKYGLSPGTLKGELFSILLNEGHSGMKLSELAKSSAIAKLNLTATFNDLENLITLALSGDMTLFEKISSSGYRLRISTTSQECEDYLSCSEDFGCVDDISGVNTVQHNERDTEYGSKDFSSLEIAFCNKQPDVLAVYNEIDESHPGELWLLGLMEGDYSNLDIDEKLSTLAALIDLLSAGPTIRMEDTLTLTSKGPYVSHYGSGAKIKRSTTNQCTLTGLAGNCGVQMLGHRDANISEQPIDSLISMSKVNSALNYTNMKRVSEELEVECYLHSMQSIFLGSDRRYNRYWLFLGPCDELDPGHRRIYFESSEDGHWEFIDTQEALCTLMLALDHRGTREAQLLASLEKRVVCLSQAMSRLCNKVGGMDLVRFDEPELNTSWEVSPSPVSDVDNWLFSSGCSKNIPSSSCVVVESAERLEQTKQFCNTQAFDASMWKSFYNELKSVKNKKTSYDALRRCGHCHDLYWRDEKHCMICHTTFELDFDLEERFVVHSAVCPINGDANELQLKRVLSSQLQVLKASIYAIESVMPESAFLGYWRRSAHNLWVNRLRRASNLDEFFQVLTDYVNALNEDWFDQASYTPGFICDQEYIFSNFSTLPHTYSAVALWLVKLDLLVGLHI